MVWAKLPLQKLKCNQIDYRGLTVDETTGLFQWLVIDFRCSDDTKIIPFMQWYRESFHQQPKLSLINIEWLCECLSEFAIYHPRNKKQTNMKKSKKMKYKQWITSHFLGFVLLSISLFVFGWSVYFYDWPTSFSANPKSILLPVKNPDHRVKPGHCQTRTKHEPVMFFFY